MQHSKSRKKANAGKGSNPKGNMYIYIVVYIMLIFTIGVIVIARNLPKLGGREAVQDFTQHNAIEKEDREQQPINTPSQGIISKEEIAEVPRLRGNRNPVPLSTLTDLDREANPKQQTQEEHREQPQYYRPIIHHNQQAPRDAFAKSKLAADLHTSQQKQQRPEAQQQRSNKNIALASGGSGSIETNLGSHTILLIIASNRPEYLKKSLSYVLQYHPKTAVPIVISQDGDNPEVIRIIQDAQRKFHSEIAPILPPLEHVHFHAQGSYENGYFRLADHFKYALNHVFSSSQIKQVIILEEDLQIAPDFYEYFAALSPFLNDPTENLLAISAWNDNGFTSQVKDNQQIYRSDFFPGLGWMLTKEIWQEDLGKKWPRAYWDDWLREPKQRLGRHILRPEVSRTLHFGAHGVSNAQYSDYLLKIQLNDRYIDFTKMDLSYLSIKHWEEYYLTQVKAAPLVTLLEAKQMLLDMTSGPRGEDKEDPEKKQGLRVSYGSLDSRSRESDSYSAVAKWSGAMDNVKANVPRTAYRGIVTVYNKVVKIHLVPKDFPW